MANNRELSQFASFVEVGISSIGITTSVGIGKTNPQFDLDVAGDINFTGTFYQGGTQFIASRWSATGSDIYRLSKVGINTSIVSSTLTVNGDVYVSGISTLGVTSTTNLTSQQLNVSGISTLGVTSATNLTAQSLSVSGISTFTNGPILVGSGTSTGTASQRLQVTGGAYVSGSVGIGTDNPQARLSIGSVSGFQDTITTVATTAATTIDSFATASFRSARAQVQITQSTNYQTSDVLIIHNGTTASIVEYGSIATNDYLGTFSVSVSGSNCLLQINMSSATSATVKVLSQRITV